MRHFMPVFCAYTFILWHTLIGGLRRRWASKPLNIFTEALEAFRTAMSFRASGVVVPTIVMYSSLIKLPWALFGLEICLSPK